GGSPSKKRPTLKRRIGPRTDSGRFRRMHLVNWLQQLMTRFGAGWVMWMLIGLSVISVAIMLERGWFYFSLRDDLPALAQRLRDALRSGDLEAARNALQASP